MLFFFFFNVTATTEIYTLSLHDALPILVADVREVLPARRGVPGEQHLRRRRVLRRRGEREDPGGEQTEDRKSTRLNSSHVESSYAVFCLKKKIHTVIHDDPRSLRVTGFR